MDLLHYGLQRSGTNLLEALLVKRFDVRFLNDNSDRGSPLQKHVRLYDDKQLIPEPQYSNQINVHDFAEFEALFDSTPAYYLVISKDPYSWYLSYRKWARKCQWPVARHHYIEEYNRFYGKFLEFGAESGRIVFIRYVELLRDAAAVLAKLELRLGLKRRRAWSWRAGVPWKVAQSAHFPAARRRYYLSEEYLAEYTDDELRELNRRLDAGVVARLGYEIRSRDS